MNKSAGTQRGKDRHYREKDCGGNKNVRIQLMGGIRALFFTDLDQGRDEGGEQRSGEYIAEERWDRECDDEGIELIACAKQVGAEDYFRGAGEFDQNGEGSHDGGVGENPGVTRVQLVI